jgi:hypothetical protein
VLTHEISYEGGFGGGLTEAIQSAGAAQDRRGPGLAQSKGLGRGLKELAALIRPAGLEQSWALKRKDLQKQLHDLEKEAEFAAWLDRLASFAVDGNNDAAADEPDSSSTAAQNDATLARLKVTAA